MTTEGFRQWFGRRDRPQVVAVGNQKGGSGKTTTAIHLLVGLLRRGLTVGSIDLDVRQGTLSRFVRNRERFAAATGIEPPMPEHRGVARSVHATVAEANDDEATRLASAFDDLIGRDWVVVDIPGDNSFLARTGHLLADVLVTPLNDSFLDLDALVRIDVDGQRIIGPSAYSVMVTDGRARQAALGGRPCDWVVMRNRLAHLRVAQPPADRRAAGHAGTPARLPPGARFWRARDLPPAFHQRAHRPRPRRAGDRRQHERQPHGGPGGGRGAARDRLPDRRRRARSGRPRLTAGSPPGPSAGRRERRAFAFEYCAMASG